MDREITFAEMREMLRKIRVAVGDKYLVSCAWDGDKLQVVVGDPSGLRAPFAMTFNDEDDYAADPATLIQQLAVEAKPYFAARR